MPPSRPDAGRAIACVCCSIVRIIGEGPTKNGRERAHSPPPLFGVDPR